MQTFTIQRLPIPRALTLRVTVPRSRMAVPRFAVPFRLAVLSILLGGGSGGAALAQAPAPAPLHGVLNLAASVSIEVDHDLLSVVLSTTRQGADAEAVQAQLKQALDSALGEAKNAVRPGLLDVHTGQFSLFPRYTDKPGGRSGGIAGWQGTAELVLEGRDMPAIGQLAGRISGMTVARVSYELSRDARAKVESELAAQAIERYRAKAAEYARNFGYAGYAIREVQVSANSQPRNSAPMMRMQAAVDSAAPLPLEPGRGEVSVNVSGSVQMQ